MISLVETKLDRENRPLFLIGGQVVKRAKLTKDYTANRIFTGAIGYIFEF